MGAEDNTDERVLIRVPFGTDAANTSRVLTSAGFATNICPDLPAVVAALAEGCGALLLTEEALAGDDTTPLRQALDSQPPWSDIPVVLITSGGHTTAASTAAVQQLGDQCSLTLVERPLRTVTLVAALTAALRSRRRQYQVRRLLIERDEFSALLEHRVTERTARLRQVIEELEAFSYSVSHDLRAPLRALEAYAQALREDCAGSLDPVALDYAGRIARAAQRMDHLTQDLLTYTRVSRHAVPLRPVELDSVLRDVLHDYPGISSRRHHITVENPLPAVLGHEPSLLQCFSNLLENAFKFTRPGLEPHVTIRSEEAGESSRVVITDNGIGIDPAHHERIFGIFERISPTAEGTGIGLAIVRRAIERMGGRVGVDSAPGEGASFWFELATVPTGERHAWTAASGEHGDR